MNNLQELKIELEGFIEQRLNEDIKLMWRTKKDANVKLIFVPRLKDYLIFINNTNVYNSKFLELAIEEYWNIIGEKYE